MKLAATVLARFPAPPRVASYASMEPAPSSSRKQRNDVKNAASKVSVAYDLSIKWMAFRGAKMTRHLLE